MVMHIGLYIVQGVYLKTLHWPVGLILKISCSGRPDGNRCRTLHSSRVYLKTPHWPVGLIPMISCSGRPNGNAYWTLHSSRGLPQDTSLAGRFDTEDIMQRPA